MGAIPVGKLIRELRLKTGLSQRKLSILSGVDRGYINQLEAGKTITITLDMASRLSKGLGLAPSVFMDLVTTEDADIKAFLVNEFPNLDEEGKDWVRRTLNMVRERQRDKYNTEK
jgi:transcriptional regulator with XRE-family HTH domain